MDFLSKIIKLSSPRGDKCPPAGRLPPSHPHVPSVLETKSSSHHSLTSKLVWSPELASLRVARYQSVCCCTQAWPSRLRPRKTLAISGQLLGVPTDSLRSCFCRGEAHSAWPHSVHPSLPASFNLTAMTSCRMPFRFYFGG